MFNGKVWFEENTTLDVTIDIASEFRYRKNRFKNDNLYIFVSQSGETADTYAALDLCNKNNMKTCSVVKCYRKVRLQEILNLFYLFTVGQKLV